MKALTLATILISTATLASEIYKLDWTEPKHRLTWPGGENCDGHRQERLCHTIPGD